ncbi:MAG: lysylphosphatidylglycerol synthase transmembrane domain-containing protein [Planctomycetota bacterium]|nr:lysylphosphatidylglycerol synthase transmembrane domain-containing protein [Planctomycetota bacterium]
MSRARSRWGGVLRAALAIVLLAVVAFTVPWDDRLVLTIDGQSREAHGVIQGEWRSDAVTFRFDAGADLAPEWPADARAAAVARAELPVTRGAAGASGYDWRPGLVHVFREMDPAGLVTALSLLLFSALVAITRWWRLLRVAGCAARWYDALRLTFIGFFMNLVLPGLTGGDVVKAVMVVRENPERRADALVTVLVDRGLGLLVLMAMAAGVVHYESERFAEVRWPVTFVFLAVLVALWIGLHPWPRRVVRVDRLLEKLPQKERLRSIDRALSIYARHPGEIAIAVVLSVLNHGSIAFALYSLGHAFGDTLSWPEYLGIAAIANTVSSVPVAPGGWGVGEALYGYLFHLLGAPTALGIAVSVSYRLLNTGLGLAGGIFLLPWVPGAREARAEMKTTDASPG